MNDNKVKIFEYLDTLVKMCRSKGNGASLIIEEEEIAEQIKEHDLEIIQVIDGRDISECAFEKGDYLGKGCKLINSEEYSGLTVEEAKEVALRAIKAATERDTYSGNGFLVAEVTKDGYKMLEKEEVESIIEKINS